MIAADTFAVIAPVTALGLAAAGRLEIWHLAVAAFLGGVGSSFQFPAAQAAIPALVEPEALGRANGLMQLGDAAGIVLGPVLATPLVAWWGIEAVLVADLATFLVAIVATTSVRFDDPPRDPAVDDDGSWAALRSWLWSDGRPLVVLLATSAGVNFLLAFFNVSVVVMATELGGVASVGLVMGAAGAAMIGGALLGAQRGVGDDRIGTCARGLAAAGVGFVIAAIRPSFALLVVGVVVALAFVPVLSAAISTIYHERVPSSMHGRMFGLRTSIARALEPAGAIISGVVVARLAEPAMADGGAFAGAVGPVVGTGPGRGAAVVLVLVGCALVAAGLRLGASGVRSQLRYVPVSSPTVDPVPTT